MFSRFFINRPIFAAVISIMTVMVGLVTLRSLPIAQYPEIAPPSIVVSAAYPGADAETIAATVATPLEQEINGVEGMLYLSSYSTADGSMGDWLGTPRPSGRRSTPANGVGTTN